MTINLEDLRIETARQASCGFSGTCTALGTTSTLIDLGLIDQGITAKFLEFAWIYRPDAAAAGDRVRRVKLDGFTITSGTLTIDSNRLWTNAPASGEVYQIFSILPPINQPGMAYSWDKAINDGLANIMHRDEIVLGRGSERGHTFLPLNRAEVVLLAFIAVDGGSGITITAPTGWTLVRRTDSGTDLGLGVYRKRALKSDPVDFEFTLTSCLASGVIVAYADVEAGGIVDVEGSTATTPASTTATAPTVTSTNDNELVIRAYAADGITTFDKPTDCIVRSDAVAEDGNAQRGLMVAEEAESVGETAGATGTRTTTIPSLINIGQTVVLKPAEAERRVSFVSAVAANNGTSATTSLVIPRPSNVPNDDWKPDRKSILELNLRKWSKDGIATDYDYSKNGRFWRIVQDGREVGVRVSPAPGTDEQVVVTVWRPWPALSADGDETDCPDRQAWTRAKFEAFHFLNRNSPTVGKYKEEERQAWNDWLAETPEHVVASVGI